MILPRNLNVLTLGELKQVVEAMDRELTEFKNAVLKREEALDKRLTDIEKWQWKSVGFFSAIVFLMEIVIKNLL